MTNSLAMSMMDALMKKIQDCPDDGCSEKLAADIFKLQKQIEEADKHEVKNPPKAMDVHDFLKMDFVKNPVGMV